MSLISWLEQIMGSPKSNSSSIYFWNFLARPHNTTVEMLCNCCGLRAISLIRLYAPRSSGRVWLCSLVSHRAKRSSWHKVIAQTFVIQSMNVSQYFPKRTRLSGTCENAWHAELGAGHEIQGTAPHVSAIVACHGYHWRRCAVDLMPSPSAWGHEMCMRSCTWTFMRWRWR